MIPHRLNLLSPEKRRHLNRMINFQFIKNIKPKYWYFKHRELQLSNKDIFKEIIKHNNYDPNKTEFEIMEELGYIRIYDCGYAVYELKLK